MQWLEIMGPHGIGKTTLRRHLRLYTMQPKHPVRNIDLVSIIEGWNLHRPTTWVTLKHWHGFLKNVEYLYTTEGGQFYDLKRRRNFCKAMLRMSMIYQSEFAGYEVWDLIGSEGMRLSFALQNLSSIRRYFEAMPVSLGVVILEADPAVVVARNAGRAPKPDFGIWAEKGATACALAASVLAERTRVLRLDATQPIENNVSAIAEFAGFKKGVVEDAASAGDLPA